MEEPGALSRVPFRAVAGAGGAAGLYRGTLTVAGRPGDADLELPGWRHGVRLDQRLLPGALLGSWARSAPLYVPGPVLREGANEVLVWEWEGAPATVGEEAGAPGLYPCAAGR